MTLYLVKIRTSLTKYWPCKDVKCITKGQHDRTLLCLDSLP